MQMYCIVQYTFNRPFITVHVYVVRTIVYFYNTSTVYI